MKYFLLKQWVTENRKQNLIVEKIYLSTQSLEICFKNRSSLIFLYKGSNPLLYFSDKINKPSDKHSAIWANLNNADLYDIDIADADRILTFSLNIKDIYQMIQEYRLIFECMPPQGNLILCRPENNKLIIIDAINKYTYADNPQRQVLPGLPYESPRTNFNPQLEKVDFPITLIPAISNEPVLCTNVNEYFLKYCLLVIEQKEQAQQKQKLLAHWQKELTKTEKKLHQQQAELKDAEKEKTWLIYSEAIKTNLGKIKKGDEKLETINYYDPEMQSISIPLKTDKNPQENLKFYLRKYQKAKQGKAKILVQLEKTLSETDKIKTILSYFESDKWILLDLDVKKPADALGKIKQTENLFRLPVNDDWEIIIGRKAKENDLISTQIGKPNDWWFHTRIYHGSHILLRNYHKKEPPHILIELCCSLAAGFSKAKSSENVPVDYTQLRFVRKPRKSAPGFVTYSNQKTVFVNPIDVSAAKEIISNYVKPD